VQARGELEMKIYVGNFDFGLTEPELQALFTPFGAVESVAVVTDRDTGRSRGFGFVEMPDASQANQAMAALNGKDMGGRPLTVNEARQKTDRGPSHRGGGGGRDSRGGFGGGRSKREPRW
jgi:cold-inducible RNA-binding protein